MLQADLMLMGRLFQSRGAAAMKDRSPVVTEEEFSCYFAVNHNGIKTCRKAAAQGARVDATYTP